MVAPATTHQLEFGDGVVTTFLPMSTRWPSTAGCETSFYINIVSGPIWAWDPAVSVYAGRDYSCQPPQVMSWAYPGSYFPQFNGKATSIVLGPLFCPQAYSTITSSVKNDASTLYWCCPSNYVLSPSTGNTKSVECQSPLGASQVITYAFSGTKSTYSTTIQKATVASALPVYGWVFKAEATATGTASTPDTTSASDTPSAPGSTSSPLGTGAVIGIAFGLLCALALGIFLFVRCRRRESQNRGTGYHTPGAVQRAGDDDGDDRSDHGEQQQVPKTGNSMAARFKTIFSGAKKTERY